MNLSPLQRRLFVGLLGVIVVAAAGLRLVGLWNGLPRYLLGRDETDYYRWTIYLQQHGTLAGSDGEGYPPALLALLLGEQKSVNLVRGNAAQVGDYFLVARLVNVAFACLGVFVGGLIAQQLTGSGLAGVLAAGYLALQPEFVEESRLATAQPPWVALALLSLWLLLIARYPTRYQLFVAAWVVGALSILFKYQTAPLLVLPLLLVAWYGQRDLRRALPAFIVISLGSGLLLAWLYFGYQANQIVNTPGSATAAIVGRNSIELMSFSSNWRLLYTEMGGLPYGIVLALGAIACFGLWRTKSPYLKLDWEGIGWLAIFSAGFYLLMSVFWEVALSKWLPVLNLLGLAWVIAVTAIAYLALTIGQRWIKDKHRRWVEHVGPALIALAFSLYTARPMVERYLFAIQDRVKPNPSTIAMDWFYENVPQGARIMSEGNLKYLFYVGSGFNRPAQFHATGTASLAAEPLRAYQERGYEYLVADSSVESDLANTQFLDQAEPVLTLMGNAYANPNLLVLRIPPLQKNVRYLWFGEAHEISFRGFDLPRSTLKAGETLELTLYWMSVKPTSANNIVFIHVWNEATQTLAASQDHPPNHGNSPTWSWVGDMQFFIDGYQIPLPTDIAPGQYTLRIGLYDADTQKRLPISEIEGQVIGDDVALAKLTIQK